VETRGRSTRSGNIGETVTRAPCASSGMGVEPVYAGPSAMTCVAPVLNAGPSAMRLSTQITSRRTIVEFYLVVKLLALGRLDREDPPKAWSRYLRW
jgi:hypothetical protein